MEIITSLDNKKVKEWSKLKNKKYRDQEGKFLVEGEHLVLEAIKSKNALELILDSEAIFPVDILKYYVNKEVLKKISSLETPPEMIAVVKKIEEKEYGDKLLLIDSIQDPGNLGTIIRSAVAFNIDTIVLGDNTVDLYNEKVIRSTQGLLFHTNIIKRNLKEFILELKAKKYQILGTKVTHGTSLDKIHLKGQYAFIMGNEGAGVSEELLDLCDDYIYIKMNDVCESLNVGCSCSIILYELNKKGENNE